jgi:hypothetical protein
MGIWGLLGRAVVAVVSPVITAKPLNEGEDEALQQHNDTQDHEHHFDHSSGYDSSHHESSGHDGGGDSGE